MAAGSRVFNLNQLICPAHLIQSKDQKLPQSRINVTWCFVCCQSGELIGCSRCPAAYHADCLKTNDARYITDDDNTDNDKLNSQPKNGDEKMDIESKSAESITSINKETWLCEDCLMNKRPLYGEIVWAKVGKIQKY